MKTYGLIGNPLSHSFSSDYFSAKFKREGIANASYLLFPLQGITELPALLASHPTLLGLNVTVPYKEEIIPFLDELDELAENIQAVNTITMENCGQPNQKLKGYNTDAGAFKDTIQPMLQPHQRKALIMGTGGAARAVAYALNQLNIEHLFVSRNPGLLNELGYEKLNRQLIEQHHIIINATPVGMAPDPGSFPDIPYKYMTQQHLLYDLVYNPTETIFLNKGKANGTATANGLKMLELQAEMSWQIWNHADIP